MGNVGMGSNCQAQWVERCLLNVPLECLSADEDHHGMTSPWCQVLLLCPLPYFADIGISEMNDNQEGTRTSSESENRMDSSYFGSKIKDGPPKF